MIFFSDWHFIVECFLYKMDIDWLFYFFFYSENIVSPAAFGTLSCKKAFPCPVEYFNKKRKTPWRHEEVRGGFKVCVPG